MPKSKVHRQKSKLRESRLGCARIRIRGCDRIPLVRDSLRGTDAQADIWPRLPGLLPIGAALAPTLASSRPSGSAMKIGVLHNVDVEFYATCCKAGYWLRLDSN